MEISAKNLEIAFKDSMLGIPRPDSHFEMAVRDMYSFSANSS